MKKFYQQRRNLIAYGLAVIILSLFFLFRNYFSDNFQWAAFQLRTPFNAIFDKITTTYSALTYFEELSDENNSLKEKNIKLIQENNDLQKLLTENQQLKNLLNYQSLDKEKNLTTARIYASDPLNLTDNVIIDKGAIDDINPGDHAIYNGMYLGKVISVTNHTGTVQLITDPQLKIVGEITDAGKTGIVHGQIGYGLIMEEISPDAVIKPGQIVSTSDIDPTLPSDLLIGEIVEVFQEDQNIFQTASLKPYFDIRDINYVLIQTNHEINS